MAVNDLAMSTTTGWKLADLLKAAFSCFLEVAFFWQLVRLCLTTIDILSICTTADGDITLD